MSVLSLQCMIHKPRWFCAWFTREAQFCNDCSLGEWSPWSASRSSGAASNKAIVFWATRVPSFSGEQRGWPQFSRPSSSCAHTAYVTLVCFVSPEPWRWQEICPEVWNHPFTERTSRVRTYNEMTGELRKDTRKWQNMKQKHPLRFGILNHTLLFVRGLHFQ